VTLRDVRRTSTQVIFPPQVDTTGATLGWVMTVTGSGAAWQAPTRADYTTDQVTEGHNQYFNAGRVRAALSAALPLIFDSSTGAFSCPTCLVTSGGYVDPAWITLTAAGGRLTGFSAVARSGSYLDLTDKPSTFPPSLHAGSHAAGQADAITPAAIGAEPADPNIVRKDPVTGSVALCTTLPCPASGTTISPTAGITTPRITSTSTDPTLFQFIKGVAPAGLDPGRDWGLGFDETGALYTLSSGGVKRYPTPPIFTGDTGAGGAIGTVPAPAAGDGLAGKALLAGGGWGNPVGASCMSTAGQGYWMPLGRNPVTAMTFSPDAGVEHSGTYFQVLVLCPMTIGKVLFNVTTGSGTGCTGGTCGFAVAVYSMAGTLLGQTMPVVSGGSPDLNGTGARSASFLSAVSLSPGAYWISALTDSTVLRLAGDASSWGIIANADGVTRIGTGTAATGNGATLAAVGTLPSLTPRSDGYSQLPSLYFAR
jgi:hypothetical protein